MTVQYDAET